MGGQSKSFEKRPGLGEQSRSGKGRCDGEEISLWDIVKLITVCRAACVDCGGTVALVAGG